MAFEGQASEASDSSDASDEPRSGEPPALNATHKTCKMTAHNTVASEASPGGSFAPVQSSGRNLTVGGLRLFLMG